MANTDSSATCRQDSLPEPDLGRLRHGPGLVDQPDRCSPSAPPPTEQLTLAHGHQPAYGLLYIAEQASFFRVEGLKITLKRYNSGRDALNAVLQGHADVGTPFDAPVVLAALEQQPVRVLGTLSKLEEYSVVLARQDRGVRTAGDLQGRRVAVAPNTSGEYVLSRVLIDAGLTTADIVSVPLPPQKAAEAMIQGQVDAVALWPQFTYQMRAQLPPGAVTTFTSAAYLEAATLTTTAGVLQQRRSAIDKLLRALLQAEALAQKQPEQALQYTQAFLGDNDPAGVALAWQTLTPSLRLDHQLHRSLQTQMQWFATLRGMSPEQIAASSIIPFLAPEPLRALRPQSAPELTPY